VEMSKQTSIEWLVEQLAIIDKNDPYYAKILAQAQQMHKEEIVNACNLQRNDYRGMPTYNKSGEDYYQETYGSSPKTSDN
jgi:hypothetical protein